MNKNPEKFAIEYLIRNGFKMEEDYNNFARQVVNVAIEALEKQISIKPKDKYYISSDGIYTGVCQCKHFVGSFNWYCDKCGQRLDWS